MKNNKTSLWSTMISILKKKKEGDLFDLFNLYKAIENKVVVPFDARTIDRYLSELKRYDWIRNYEGLKGKTFFVNRQIPFDLTLVTVATIPNSVSKPVEVTKGNFDKDGCGIGFLRRLAPEALKEVKQLADILGIKDEDFHVIFPESQKEEKHVEKTEDFEKRFHEFLTGLKDLGDALKDDVKLCEIVRDEVTKFNEAYSKKLGMDVDFSFLGLYPTSMRAYEIKPYVPMEIDYATVTKTILDAASQLKRNGFLDKSKEKQDEIFESNHFENRQDLLTNWRIGLKKEGKIEMVNFLEYAWNLSGKNFENFEVELKRQEPKIAKDWAKIQKNNLSTTIERMKIHKLICDYYNSQPKAVKVVDYFELWKEYQKTGGKILDTFEREMQLKDLKPGMIVEYENGERRLVILGLDGILILQGRGYNKLENYLEDLTNNDKSNRNLDINTVYEPKYLDLPFDDALFSENNLIPIWTRLREYGFLLQVNFNDGTSVCTKKIVEKWKPITVKKLTEEAGANWFIDMYYPDIFKYLCRVGGKVSLHVYKGENTIFVNRFDFLKKD